MEILIAGVIGNLTAILTTAPAQLTINADTMNILIGIGVAIAVLLLIILFVCVTKFQQLTSKLEGNTVGPQDLRVAQSSVQEESEYIDDSELVAVITAAICASMGKEVSPDGFVVRSIRKTNARRWKNA